MNGRLNLLPKIEFRSKVCNAMIMAFKTLERTAERGISAVVRGTEGDCWFLCRETIKSVVGLHN